MALVCKWVETGRECAHESGNCLVWPEISAGSVSFRVRPATRAPERSAATARLAASVEQIPATMRRCPRSAPRSYCRVGAASRGRRFFPGRCTFSSDDPAADDDDLLMKAAPAVGPAGQCESFVFFAPQRLCCGAFLGIFLWHRKMSAMNESGQFRKLARLPPVLERSRPRPRKGEVRLESPYWPGPFHNGPATFF